MFLLLLFVFIYGNNAVFMLYSLTSNVEFKTKTWLNLPH